MTFNYFIERHARAIRIYMIIAAAVGWLLVATGVIQIGLAGNAILNGRGLPHNKEGIVLSFAYLAFLFGVLRILNTFMLGLVALVCVHLLKFVISRKRKIGLFLKQAPLILYVAVAISFVHFSSTTGLAASEMLGISHTKEYAISPIAFTTVLLVEFGKILVALGFAFTLSRVLPIIEESKVLV